MNCARCGGPIVERPPSNVVDIGPRCYGRHDTEVPSGAHAVCPACADTERYAEHRVSMAAALRSIPEKYRDAVWGSPELRERVADIGEFRIGAAALMSPRVLLLHGESGAGKTTLACALLRWAIDDAGPDAPPDKIGRASAARFVAARDVPPSRDVQGPLARVVARKASLLVLDDVGQEAGAGESYSAGDRTREVKDLLEFRFDGNMRTIVTTYGNPRTWALSYGGGVVRRYWDDPDARVIELKRRAT